MLTQEEINELKFFADKVATVHWPDHEEYIRVNEIVKETWDTNLAENDSKELKELTNSYVIPEWACKAETALLTLLKKYDT